MSSAPNTDPARRSRLLALKLAALVRDHAGEAPVEPGIWPGGAALIRRDMAWVLAEDHPLRALGPALAWARQHGAARVQVIAERGTGVLARRAALFTEPVPSVWHAEERNLLPALGEPYAPPQAPLAAHERFVGLIEAAGATVVREHGVLSGEVEGLEVCRATRDPVSGVDRLEVGVGAHDREAFLLIHGDVPPAEPLARIVAEVRAHRRPGAAPHPLNRLAAERLLRARILAEPGLVGATELHPADPPVPRPNIKDAVPCVAAGRDAAGRPTVVVCSVGIDLDLVPFAADARAALGDPQASLVLAVPRRDVSPVTAALNARLRVPGVVIGLDRPV